jgi:hypothetical protein
MTPEERLTEIAGLPDGWDGYGASHVLPEAIAAARTILSSTGDDGVDIFPVANGSIQLEWAGCTVEVASAGEAGAKAEFSHGAATGTITGDAEAIAPMLTALLRMPH